MLYVLWIILSLIRANEASQCKPTFTEVNSNLYVGGSMLSKCEVTTCDNVIKVIYEKAEVEPPLVWTQVYEGITDTNHNALNTTVGYSLDKRVSYAVLSKSHFFEIKDLQLSDIGRWMCVSFDETNIRYESNILQLDIEETDCSVTIQINDNHPRKGDALFIDCIASHCENITKVQFEIKSDLSKQWVSVYQYINKTNKEAVNTWIDYTLANRTKAAEQFSRFTLIIEPVVIQDHGKWRCVLYNSARKQYWSYALDVTVLVIPDVIPVISPSSPAIVTNQTCEFTCEIQGIHPEPTVIWNVNGKEYVYGTSNSIQNDDGLWSVRSTIRLTFDNTGDVDMICAMTISYTEQSIATDIKLDVKEAARVIYPVQDTKQEIHSVSNFTLTCIGSGYNHSISWRRNGMKIGDSNKFTITACDSVVGVCASNISGATTNEECRGIDHYTGVYACVVELHSPYNSSETSAEIMVTVLDSWTSSGTPENSNVSCIEQQIDLPCNSCKWDKLREEWSCAQITLEGKHEIFPSNVTVELDIRSKCIAIADDTIYCDINIAKDLTDIVISKILAIGIILAVVSFMVVNNVLCCCVIHNMRAKQVKIKDYYYYYYQNKKTNPSYVNATEEDRVAPVEEHDNDTITYARTEEAMYEELD